MGYLVAFSQPAWRRLRHADSLRSAGEYGGARKQGGAAAEEFDQGRNAENHVVRVPILHDLAVEQSLNAQRVWVGDGFGRREARPKRRERVKPFPAAPLGATPFELPVARANVIATGVAGDVFEGAAARDVRTAPPPAVRSRGKF